MNGKSVIIERANKREQQPYKYDKCKKVMLFNFTRSANSAEEAKQFLGLINVNGHFTGIDMGTFLAQTLSAQMTHLAYKE